MFKKRKEFKTDYLQIINCDNDFLELCFLHKSLYTEEEQEAIVKIIFDGLTNCKDSIKVNYYFNNKCNVLQIQFELLKDNKETKQLKKNILNDLFNYLKNNYDNYKNYLI